MDIRSSHPPLAAILRGLPAARAREVGAILFDAGFGIGSRLYRPGMGHAALAARARGLVAAWKAE